MKRYLILVAGGKGERMGTELPKQFLPLGDGRPMLMHTLDAFLAVDSAIVPVLVLPAHQHECWKAYCRTFNYTAFHLLTQGGETRFHSVKNGLDCIEGEGLVAVHDGVRPFVSAEVIERCYTTAAEQGAVVPVIPVVETVRKLTSQGSETVDRDAFRLVQTPQVFTVSLLKRAYAQPYTKAFTDDASVVESINVPVVLVEGNRENIKITTPFDLIVAKAIEECSI